MSRRQNKYRHQKNAAQRGKMSAGTLIGLLRKVSADVKSEFSISYWALFGSTARGENGYASDIDILVQFTTAPSLLEMARLEQLLSDYIGRRVDVVVGNDASDDFLQRISRDLLDIEEYTSPLAQQVLRYLSDDA